VNAPVCDHRRVIVDHVRPTVDGGTQPAKAAAGQALEVSADLVCDGTDELAAIVRLRPASAQPPGRQSRAVKEGARRRHASAVEAAMAYIAPGLDRWAAVVTPATTGAWEFEIAALPDAYATWVRDLQRRAEAGQDIEVELEVGARIVEARSAPPRETRALRTLAARFRDQKTLQAARALAAADRESVTLMRRTIDWTPATVAGPFPLAVDRSLAAFSAWYEFFPRSVGAQPPDRSGTLCTATHDLPRIAAMGFDIVYLPPVHPIGTSDRKGRNNTTTPDPTAPGSPWAIGDVTGGHTEIHPDLGTIDDFDRFVNAAGDCGLEVALDLALQCSPDHPWVKEHPGWFRHLPDGSVRFAENPPKRYQDIYPIDFDTPDREALERALLKVVLFWIHHGVRVFRVDNPHTKPLRFWKWLIATVHLRHPDVLFLAEAFTRPRVMERLAKDGFAQSYTYFTWRNTKWELSEYLEQLSRAEMVDWFRPNFWVNTPDILHEYLQRGGPPAFRVRAVLAALACPSWGMYSGYELCENVALRAGSEEYIDSEKYQYRPRNYQVPTSIAPFITRLNHIRRSHRDAVWQLRTLRLHHVDGDQLMAISRMDDDRRDVLLVIVNLDPLYPHDGMTGLDLASLGMPWDALFEAHDELTDTTYVWSGPRNYVRLDPAVQPAHVFHLRPR
jgi:starch synthase (maltosyl-transferring)